MSNHAGNNEKNFPFLKILFKKLIYVIVAVLLMGAMGFAYGKYYVKPTYTASTALILTMKTSEVGISGSQTTTELTLAKYYMPTVADLVVSPEAIKKANLKYEGEGKLVSAAISIAFKEESLIFSLSYTDVGQQMASDKLDALIEGMKELLSANDSGQKEQTYLKANNVGITHTQNKNVIEINSATAKFTVLGVVAGGAISMLILFVIYKSDKTIKSKADFEEMTGIDVLSMISNK